MKKLAIALLLVCASAHATTYWIRHDGGTNVQCTGTTNAAYPGTGTGVACAFNHPYQMLAYNGTWAHFTSGDTMQFSDPTSNITPYYMGEQNGGIGTDWGGPTSGAGPLGGICPIPNQAYPAGSGCILPPPPDNTSIVGQNYHNCHQPFHTGLNFPTILSGINGAFTVLDVQGTTGVVVSCIEITQPDNCTTAGIGSGGGCSGSANYVSTAGLILEYLTSQGPRNLILQDIMVAGTAANGILGSHLNTTGSDVITGSDIYLWGNGSAGFNSDGGGCGTSCESVGTMNLYYMDVEANGCLLLKPFDNTQGPTQGTNAFNYCFGQNTAGYGDGFVLIAAGAFTVNVTNSTFKYNTQDGFDGLHLSDDITTSPVTNISNSCSEGNGGQAFKLGSGATASAINNVGIANCHVLTQSTSFPNNPSGWITLDYGDSCRAAGDQWSFQLKNGSSLLLENNTMLGYGTTMLELGCAAGASSCGSNGATVTEVNDLHMGFGDPGNSGQLASGWNLESGILSTTVSADHNLWYSMRSGCPDNALTGETNFVCGDPMMQAETNPDALNPALLIGSAAISAGSSSVCPDTDGIGQPQTSPCTIGARVYTTGIPTVATPTFSPVAGTYPTTQTVMIALTTPFSVATYTLDGTTPAVNSACTVLNGMTYAFPPGSGITISSTTTVKAIGCAPGYVESAVATAVYTINPSPSAPTFSPPGGTYTSTQTVTLSTTTTPCIGFMAWNTTNAQSGGMLTGISITNPFTVSSTETVYAQVQSCPSYVNSTITSAAYTINSLTTGSYTPSSSIQGTVVK